MPPLKPNPLLLNMETPPIRVIPSQSSPAGRARTLHPLPPVPLLSTPPRLPQILARAQRESRTVLHDDQLNRPFTLPTTRRDSRSSRDLRRFETVAPFAGDGGSLDRYRLQHSPGMEMIERRAKAKAGETYEEKNCRNNTTKRYPYTLYSSIALLPFARGKNVGATLFIVVLFSFTSGQRASFKTYKHHYLLCYMFWRKKGYTSPFTKKKDIITTSTKKGHPSSA